MLVSSFFILLFFVTNSAHRTIVMHRGLMIRDLSTADFIADSQLISSNQLDYTYKNICGQEIMKMQEAAENRCS